MTELICEICLELFGDKDSDPKAPRILKCGHTFCTQCIKEMAAKSEGKLLCPLDRTEACDPKKINELIINRAILTALEKNKLTKSTQCMDEDLKSEIDEKSLKIDKEYKIISLGTVSTGKSSICGRYINGTIEDIYQPTLGVDLFRKILKVKEQVIKLTFFDTSGSERFQGITSGYIRGSHGVYFVFDMTQRYTFEALGTWIDFNNNFNDNPNCIKILIANKSDLKEKRTVSEEEGKKFAKENDMEYFEVSAVTGENVQNAFRFMAEKLVDLPAKENTKKGLIMDVKTHLRKNNCWKECLMWFKNLLKFS